MSAYRKKLIEAVLPLSQISEESARRKIKAPKGYPTAIHKWWAQRPVACCTAMLFAQLVDDPSAHPERFPDADSQEKERQRLFELIERLILWDNRRDTKVWEAARSEIENSSTSRILPAVVDPFSGGGTIPLQAAQLGLVARGLDLNPVAVLIGKALVEILPRFRDTAIAALPREGQVDSLHHPDELAKSVAADIREFGEQFVQSISPQLSPLYPPIRVKGPDKRAAELTVAAWLWARTVVCPNPACRADLPLLTTHALSTRKGKLASLEVSVDSSVSPPEVTYRVKQRAARPSDATKVGKGVDFRCPACGDIADGDYIKRESTAGRMGKKLLAIAADRGRSRLYFDGCGNEQSVVEVELPSDFPDIELSTHSQYMGPPRYGMVSQHQLYTTRQLATLCTLTTALAEFGGSIERALVRRGLAADGVGLAAGGNGARAYSDAIVTYLALAVDRYAAYGSTLATWLPKDNAIKSSFPRQVVHMTWDFAEANPLGGTGANLRKCIDVIASCVENLPLTSGPTVNQGDAASLALDEDHLFVVNTDPPYYDNVPYADLSDYFYVWLRRALSTIWADLFRTLLPPKRDEMVADVQRHGGRESADQFFLERMVKAVRQMVRISSDDYPIVLYYAFRQSDDSVDGVSSVGWVTFLEALITAGLSISATWPARTESPSRIRGIGANALASSIVVVCRKKDPAAPSISRADFVRQLRRELPAAVRLLQTEKLAPVDLAQSSIGPGMSIFTRFRNIVQMDGTDMTVKAALQLINSTLDECLSEQDSDFDPETRFAITWFESYGMEQGPYGVAETLATARGVAVQGVRDVGILESRAGQVRLLTRDEISEHSLRTKTARSTTWEAVQRLARHLSREGERSAANLLRELGSLADQARTLAYRLYSTCERRGWAEEGTTYNGLIVAWPELEKLAGDTADTPEAQAELFE